MKNRLLQRLTVLTLLVATALLTACGGEEAVTPIQDQDYYLDTICTVSIYEINGGLDEEDAQNAIAAAFDRCRELDKTLSNTVAASDVSKINDANGEWVTVGDDARTVIEAGIEYGDISDGAFDITIGTVTDLWDFHTDDPVVPSDDDIQEALTHVNYKNIEVDGNRIRLLDPGAKLDLGGIAKGYVGDEMKKVLEDNGVTSAIINLGGNVIAIGAKPDGSDFVVGIEKPFSDRTDIIGSTSVHDATVVTSGIYERQFTVDDTLYHHVLSSRTGYPVDTDLEAVSLVTSELTSMDADAMSTICLMKGTAEAQKFIASQDGVEATFCPADGDISTSEGMHFTAS